MSNSSNFPQENKGFYYEFDNNALTIKGNLAVSKDLGSIIMEPEELKAMIIKDIVLICVKSNWYLSVKRSYPYSEIAKAGGVENLYTALKQELIGVRDFLVEHNKEVLIENYIKKLHGK